ncbi:hypothetical protein GCM10029964_015720 [Kibdelosporangium lantanae]
MRRVLFLVPLLVAAMAHPAAAEPSRQQQEAAAQAVAAHLTVANSGYWFDPSAGRLVVAVTSQEAATQARTVGAEPKLVARTQADLDRLKAGVDRMGRHEGVVGWGVDPRVNALVVWTSTPYPADFVDEVRALDPQVRVVKGARPVQQSGTVQPGNPWWPGSESNCSVGFPATDSSGGKHFVTAGHCTNDANQPAYGQSGQQNRLGTSNSGGTHSVNAREGDMGVVDVTEPNWNLSATVNTWGQPAVTVTGSTEPIVGMSVCHSGNTSHWQCGTVTAVNQTIDYGTTVVEGLATTTACSLGGDSGGAWLAGDKAVGLHSGGQSSCTPGGADDQSIFQPVNEALGKWGLTLATGGQEPPPSTRVFSNTTDYPIRDFQVAVSPLSATADGRATSPVTVTVTATHTCYEDLNINLVGPSGRYYALARYGGASCTPFGGTRTYQAVVNENATGTWTLRIGDNGPGDTGVLDAWTVSL